MIVTLLTGRRPDLLAQTLASLEDTDLDIIVFVNDGLNDDATFEIADACPWVAWDRLWGEWVGVAEAMNRIASYVIDNDDGGYWLHLEDDWQLTNPLDLSTAQAFLDEHPEVGQVRLRRTDDGASRRNYLTKKRIVWEGEGIKVGNAHATWNPALQRTSAALVYPVTGEVDFMRKMPQINAQTDPGHFRHLGEGRSLR